MNIRQLKVCAGFMLSLTAHSTIKAQDRTTSSKPAASHASTSSQPQQDGDGAKIFQQNCSRCHNTPDGFSPRISGTVTQHMRVRASLSKKDVEQILRFLNP